MTSDFSLDLLDEDVLNLRIDNTPSLKSQLLKTKVNVEYGYFYMFWASHLNATKGGKVFLHRHIGAVMRGSWLEKGEIVVFLDGDKKNLRASNLEITSRKERGRIVNYLPKGGPRQNLVCTYCGKSYTETYSHAERRKTCSPLCSQLSRRKFDPDPAELEELVWEMPTTKVAEIFGVSDKAISKRCKLFNIKKPPRGYWAKVNAGYLPEKTF